MSRYMILIGQNARKASLDKVNSKTKNKSNYTVQANVHTPAEKIIQSETMCSTISPTNNMPQRSNIPRYTKNTHRWTIYCLNILESYNI